MDKELVPFWLKFRWPRVERTLLPLPLTLLLIFCATHSQTISPRAGAGSDVLP